MKYRLVEDSNYRLFLKEEGYGFIGQVKRADGNRRYVLPMNKGWDLTREQLEAALEKAR